MKTRTFLAVAFTALLISGASMSFGQSNTGNTMEDILAEIRYPVFAEETNLQGNVNLLVISDSQGFVKDVKAWGTTLPLVDHVMKQLNAQDLSAVAVNDPAGMKRYQMKFALEPFEMEMEMEPNNLHKELESILGEALREAVVGLHIPSSSTANVIVKSNQQGLIEEFRVWGTDHQLNTELGNKLQELAGLTFNDVDHQEVKYFRLEVK